MKKLIRIPLVILVVVLTMSLFSCDLINDFIAGIDSYVFSDIVMTQTGVDDYRIDFTVNCGRDNVKIYFTESSRLTEHNSPIEVEKSIKGREFRGTFYVEDFELGEEYYLWAVGNNKDGKISIPAPSMFPEISEVTEAGATFNFKYTYGVQWSAFCDPEGKSVYVSSSPVFDDSATLIQDKIAITDETCVIPSDVFASGKYFYSVSTAKDGDLKIISCPVVPADTVKAEIDSISAKLTNDLALEVVVDLKDGTEFFGTNAEHLQLVIKNNYADEIYVCDATYSNGVAVMSVDCTQLIFDGLWYDIGLAYRGSYVFDIPKTFNGKQVDGASVVKKDDVVYNIIGWKPEEADESATVLKVYYEYDTTRYADEYCKSYLVSFTVDPVPALVVTVVLDEIVETVPVLALTGGDTVRLASVEGTLNDDRSYTYVLPVEEALTTAGQWYDIRLFFGKTPFEFLKDSCITYADFAAKYNSPDGARIYEFREYNGMLKIMYSDTVSQ